MTSVIAPWQRPSFRPAGRNAIVTLIAFADENVLGAEPDLRVGANIPQAAPVAGLDLRIHEYADSPAWIDG